MYLIAKSNNSEVNKRLITSKVSDIISLKENKFNEVMIDKSFAIYEDNFKDKIGIYYSPYSDDIEEFITAINRNNVVRKVYYYNQEHLKDMLSVLKIDMEEIPIELMNVLNTIEE